MSTLEIRPLATTDRDAWLPLWRGYQTFYKAALSEEVTTMTWQRFHDPAVPMYALGAFADGRLIGIAHYILHHSCWATGYYCYLQDLFVHDAARGKGAGRALVEALYAMAPQHGADRVYWLTNESNTDAMKLYDKIAAKTGFLQYRKMLG
jgi:GNAT superfamily N-acetyltransferase